MSYQPSFLRDIAQCRAPVMSVRHTSPCPPCGEATARSLPDNSKIRRALLLLMSRGRSWEPVRPSSFRRAPSRCRARRRLHRHSGFLCL
nr:hypothetical protein [Cronobacter dublinensis]